MSSKRDAILNTLVAALGAGGGPSGLTVSRHRTLPLGRNELPAQIVYAVDEEVNTGPGMGVPGSLVRKARRKLKFAVETRAVVTVTADQTLDPLLSWSVQQIGADPTLGGTVHDLKELGTVWSEADADAIYAGARQFFEVDYVTSSANPDSSS